MSERKSVTVVGSGASPISQGWGKVIDATPVIRMHDSGWQSGQDYGERTDFVVWPGPWRPQKVLLGMSRVPAAAYLAYVFDVEPWSLPAEHERKPVVHVSVAWALKRLTPYVPTRGLSACLMALYLGYRELHLVGFDSLKAGAITPYAEGAGHLKHGQRVGDQANKRHDYTLERDLLAECARTHTAVVTFGPRTGTASAGRAA